MSPLGLGMDYEDNFLQYMTVALVTLEIPQNRSYSWWPWIHLSSAIINPEYSVPDMQVEIQRFLTLVQGFDCGNKYDYWSCI